jgi:hypothetical protein
LKFFETNNFRKKRKLKKSTTKTSYSIRSETTNNLNPTNSSSQHANKIMISKKNNKGLKTEASFEKNEENFDDIVIDLASDRSNMLYLIMNSNQFHTSEYGLSHLKCLRCNRRLELYNEETIGTLIVICSTFVHRECTLAAPFLIDMIMAILKYFLYFSNITIYANSFLINGFLLELELHLKKCIAGKQIAIFIFLEIMLA